jgi:hypothetical protein
MSAGKRSLHERAEVYRKEEKSAGKRGSLHETG